jgi:hypothetical protein
LFSEPGIEEKMESHSGGCTMSKKLVIATITLGLLVSVPLFAHHGSASYSTDKQVILKGTVTRWLYASPHLLLMLDVKGENGEVTHWVLESQSPTVMYPTGYRKDSFKPGDEVSVTASQARNGKPIGRIIEAITADGTKLGRLPAAASQDQPDVSVPAHQ